MASYTDQTPTFTPYVAQQPVEAMVKVGMQKQAQYDAGYQKIQNSIDKVAGLELARDVDKEYMQGKLDQLGNDLKYVAAGDFSNFQMTNSVAGMANKIVNDENIQNAVASTQKYKTGLTDMRTASKAGKGGASNEWDFNRNANEWLMGDADATFNYTYTPYSDYKARAIEIVQELTGSSTISEEAFTMDANGNLVLSDDMIRTEMGGISPEQINQALRAGLRPEDMNQMQLDGMYQYSGETPEQLVSIARNNSNVVIQAYAQQKADLEAALTTTTSVPQKSMINNKIKEIDTHVEKLNKSTESTIASILENPDAARAKLGVSNFMDSFSKAFSYTEYSQTREKNNAADMALRREIRDMQWKKDMLLYEQAERFHEDNVNLKLGDQSLAAAKLAAEAGEGGSGRGFPGALRQGDVDVPTYAISAGKIIQDEQTLANRKREFLTDMNKDSEWLDIQETAWNKTPTSVDPLVASYFNGIQGLKRSTDANNMVMNKISDQVNTEMGDIYTNIPADAEAVIMPTSSGNLVYTPKELVDFNSIKDDYVSVYYGGGLGGSVPATIYDTEKALRELSPKQFGMFDVMRRYKTGEALTEDEVILKDELLYIQENVNDPFRRGLNERTARMDELAKEKFTVYQPKGFMLPTDKKLGRDELSNVVSNIIKIAEGSDGGLANSPYFDLTKAKEIIGAGANMTGTLSVADGTEFDDPRYEITITGKDGVQTTFSLTEEQKRIAFGTRYERSTSAQFAKPYIEQMRKMGGKTTGTSPGPTTVDNAYLYKKDFAALNVYGVTGNVVSLDGNSYGLRLNIYDPELKMWREDVAYPASGLFREDQMIQAMSGLTDEVIYNILYGISPTTNDMKRVKTATEQAHTN